MSLGINIFRNKCRRKKSRGNICHLGINVVQSQAICYLHYFFPFLKHCASYSKSSSHRGFPKKLLCACYFAFTFTGEEEEDGDDDELHYSPPMLADAQ